MDTSISFSLYMTCDGGYPPSVDVSRDAFDDQVGVGAHQSFNSALGSVANPLNDPCTQTTTVRENGAQPSTSANLESPSILDWARGMMQESPDLQDASTDGEYASKAALAIEQHEGTGVNRQPFNNDQQIGPIELANTSGITSEDSLALRNLGDGNGFLNQQELEQALQNGLITIHDDGTLSLIGGGDAASPNPCATASTPTAQPSPTSPPISTSSATNEPGFTGTGLNGRDFYPDNDGDGDADVATFVSDKVDIGTLQTSIEKLEEGSGGRIDFQVVTGADQHAADQHNGIWIDVLPEIEFPSGALGVAKGNDIKIKEGFEDKLQIVMHEIMHTLDLHHADGDNVLASYNGNRERTELSPFEIDNLIKTAQDYSPGANNQSNTTIGYAQYSDLNTTA